MTVTCAVAVHPAAEVPVTVYVVVDVGLAVTVDAVVLLKPEEGLQLYVFAPPAVNVVDCPKQIATGGETVTTGNGLTVTVTCAVAVHPAADVPVTVYVVVEEGLAVTDEPVVLLKPVEGLQL